MKYKNKYINTFTNLSLTPIMIISLNHDNIIINALLHQQEEERLSTIQRDNQMLLDKISHIKQTSGQIDCRNEYVNKR